MSVFTRYDEPPAGFQIVAGSAQGLSGLLVAAGRLAAEEDGPMHLHHGDEVLRILDGELVVTVGEQVRRCVAGDVISVPGDTLHGFRTITEVRLGVVAVPGAGQVFRRDMPWSRTPPPGVDWTTDTRMQQVRCAAEPLTGDGIGPAGRDG